MNFVLGIALASALGTVALADTPRDVAELVGVRASSGENALRDEGYFLVKSEKGSDRIWSNWWNSRNSNCISVVTRDGRYDSIVSAPAFDCNQSESDHNDDDDKAAAIAIGAAALIGAVALAHNSHHHDNGQHYDNVDHEADFERGHRDGLYGHSYDNYSNSNEYSSGYQSGVRQRNNNSSYRGGGHSSYSNYREQNVRTSDLVGARAAGADEQMESRGFRHVGNETSGYTDYSIWYNPNSRQCLQMAVAEGRVDSIVDIHSHSGCR